MFSKKKAQAAIILYGPAYIYVTAEMFPKKLPGKAKFFTKMYTYVRKNLNMLITRVKSRRIFQMQNITALIQFSGLKLNFFLLLSYKTTSLSIFYSSSTLK